MTSEERDKFTKMEQSVEEIKTDISVIKSALIGNQLSGDKGLIGRVSALQVEIERLEKDIKELQDEKTTNSVYIKQLSYVVGVVVASAVGLVIKTLFF